VLRAFDRILGINARNARIAAANPPGSIALVNNKFRTKEVLEAAGAPTAPTLRLIRQWREVRELHWDALPDQWALKPNESLGGSGIMLAAGRRDGQWHTGSGRPLPVREVCDHLRLILDGEFSPRSYDWALFEPLLVPHPDLARLSFQGLPDIRVICAGDDPRIAMLRLPTSASGGRANLHQRAIGASVDLDTGRVTAAWSRRTQVTEHPDTGAPLLGATVPEWEAVLHAASLCAGATGLGYVGADIVVDARRGALILEVNARPGLQIQNVTGRGLLEAMA